MADPSKQVTIQLPHEIHKLFRAAAYTLEEQSAALIRNCAIVGLSHLLADPDFKQKAEIFGDMEELLNSHLEDARKRNPEAGVSSEGRTYAALENRRPPVGATGSLRQSIEEGKERARVQAEQEDRGKRVREQAQQQASSHREM